MIRRRLIIEFDPPQDWPRTFSEIRRMSGFGSSEICFALNIGRETLSQWEAGRNKPNFEHGRAVLKLHAHFVSIPTPRVASIAA